MAMTSNLKVFSIVFVFLSYFSNSCCQNQEISDAIESIFLTKRFTSSDSELIFKSARESYLLLRETEKKPRSDEKLNFAKNYANFLLQLFKELQAKDVDIYELFTKQNSFLRDYDTSQNSKYVNVTELKSKIEDLEFAAERRLVAFYNSSDESFKTSEVLTQNDTSFEVFLNKKLQTDFSEVGYFFLEIFATLIALSWGFISTVIYYTDSATESISQAPVF